MKAGASFRNDERWKEQFEDEENQSTVRRSGRFGIGAFAAFLLGDEIKLRTRCPNEEKGLQFSASINSSFIEIFQTNCPIGTQIEVPIRKEISHDGVKLDVDWDFYIYPCPKVLRVEKGNLLTSQWQNIKTDIKADPKFVKVGSTNYSSVRLTRENLFDRYSFDSRPGDMFCNGIPFHSFNETSFWKPLNTQFSINRNNSRPGEIKITPNSVISVPTVAIDDKNGDLPLTLQRYSLANQDRELTLQTFNTLGKEYVAQAIAMAPEKNLHSLKPRHFIDSPSECFPRTFERSYGGLNKNKASQWAWYQNGWVPNDNSILPESYSCSLTDFSEASRWEKVRNFDDAADGLCIDWSNSAGQFIGESHNIVKKISQKIRHPDQERITVRHYKAMVSESIVNAMYSTETIDKAVASGDFYLCGKHWVIGSLGFKHPLENFIPEIFEDCESSRPIIFGLWEGEDARKPDELSRWGLLRAWKDYTDNKPIPPNFEERKSLFPKAFEELGDRIEYYRSRIRS